MSKKKKILIATILAIVIASIGIAYGAFTYTRGGTYTSKLVAGDIYMRYKEGSALNISNQMPSSTYPTKATNNYFQFQIIGKNTHSEGDIEYTLKLVYGDVPQGKPSANRIADQWLYFKLVEVSNLGEANETETAVVTDANWNSIANQVLYTTTIPKNTSNEITKTYRLYARISDNLTIGTGGNYEISTWNNLFGSVKVNAEGEYKTIPIISSCPDCKFMYNTNMYSFGTNGTLVENITETVSSNYRDVMPYDKKSFIGFTELNGKINKAYLCGEESGIPFCVEPYLFSDSAKPQEIVDMLTPIFGTWNEETQNGCHTTQDDNNYWFYCKGLLIARASGGYTTGSVHVGSCLGTASYNMFNCMES